MNNALHNISLDMHKTTSQCQIEVKRGDSARTFAFTFRENGKLFPIDHCTAVFRGKKPDGTVLYNDCEIEDNTAYYDLTNQTVAAVGIVECEVTLYSPANHQITSPRFTLMVEDTVQDDDEIESSDEFTALETALEEVENLDVDVSKSGKVVTISVTHKDGNTDSVDITDTSVYVTDYTPTPGTAGIYLIPVTEVSGDADIGDLIMSTSVKSIYQIASIVSEMYRVQQIAVIPTKLSELEGDSSHRLVTDEEKARWNAGGGAESAGASIFTTVYGIDTDNYILDEDINEKHDTLKEDDLIIDVEAWMVYKVVDVVLTPEKKYLVEYFKNAGLPSIYLMSIPPHEIMPLTYGYSAVDFADPQSIKTGDILLYKSTGSLDFYIINGVTGKQYFYTSPIGGTSSLSLGETSSTAYRGDRGKTAYDHSQSGATGGHHEISKLSGSDTVVKVDDKWIGAKYDDEGALIRSTYAYKVLVDTKYTKPASGIPTSDLAETATGTAIEIDTTPTSGSSNLITSGGVYAHIASLNGNGVAY